MSNQKLKNRKFRFDKEILEQIFVFTVRGCTLKKISSIEGMPDVHVLYYWNKKYPCLRRFIKLGKSLREEYELERKIENLMSLQN